MNLTHSATFSRTKAAAIPMLLVLAVTSACGSQRSVESFCSTLESEGASLRAKYVDRAGGLDAESDPLGSFLMGVGSLIEAQGDLVVLFDKLEAAAPDAVRSEVAAIRQSLQKQVEASGGAVSDPLGGLGESLVAGLSVMGSYRTVEQFISANCDLSFMGGF